MAIMICAKCGLEMQGTRIGNLTSWTCIFGHKVLNGVMPNFPDNLETKAVADAMEVK